MGRDIPAGDRSGRGRGSGLPWEHSHLSGIDPSSKRDASYPFFGCLLAGHVPRGHEGGGPGVWGIGICKGVSVWEA